MTVQFTKSEMRLLTNAEIDQIIGGEGEEIVVIGRRNSSGAIIGFTTGTASDVEPPPRFGSDTTEIQPTQNEGLPPIVVRVSVTNSANQARAEEAARKLILALAEALQKLNAVDRSTVFQFAGKSYTVGKVIDDINRTDYVVTDRTDFGNNGVGAATYGVDEAPHVNEINFEHILSGYGSPSDNLGLMSLIFHDLGHLSLPGYDFRVANIAAYERETADVRGDWNDSEYARNIERFANEFLVAVTSAAQIARGLIPSPGLGAEDPNTIYERRVAERAAE